MCEVSDEDLEHFQDFLLVHKAEFDEFPEKTHRFQLRLNVDLIFLANVPSQLAQEQRTEIVRYVRHHRSQSGRQSRVKRQQVVSSALHIVQSSRELPSIDFGIELRTELHRRLVNQVPIDAVGQLR